MGLSYEFSIGSVRAREKRLFSHADLEQMLSLESESELVRFLKDKGYGEGKTTDEILESNAENMWKYLRSIAPDMSVFYPFLLQNDIHNLKTILKGLMFDKSYDGLLLEPCTIDTRELTQAAEHKKFGIFPEPLAKAAGEAYDIIARSKDARLGDGIIDRAVLEMLLKEGEKSGSEFLLQYFRTFVFYANIKTALRGARCKASMDYFENVLCEWEDFDKRKITEKAMSGSEVLVKYLEKVTAYDCHKAIKCYEESAAAFEKFTENKLIRLAREKCRFSNEGAEALFGYYLGCEYERKAVHIIAGGIKTRTSQDKIRERLRDLYG